MSKYDDIAGIFYWFMSEVTSSQEAAATLTLAYIQYEPDPDKPVTIEEAARHFKVSESLIARLIRGGAVPSLKLGRAVRIKLSDLEDHFGAVDDKLEKFAA